jgi:uncharacterized membrane-anchored protein YjiN (DUF445 family)
VLEERLDRVDAAGWIIEHLDDPRKVRLLARRIAPVAGDLAAAFADESMGELVGRAARKGAEALPAAPIAGRILTALREDGEADMLYERGVDLAAGWVRGNEAFIRRKVEENSARWIPGWVDRMLAERVINGVLATLEEARAPQHAWRAAWDEWVAKTALELSADPKLKAQGEALKKRLLDSPRLKDEARRLWGTLKDRATARPEALKRGLEQALAAVGKRLAEDAEAREAMNRWVRALVLKAVAPRATEIAHFVTETVERWDAATVVERLEMQVGRDLQYIRINGTVVGGLVGVLIHAVGTVV